MHNHFIFFSRYNLWANRTLYAAVSVFSAEEIARDRNGFFGSILGTLNHLIVGDRVWLARMTKQDYSWFKSLDQILFSDFDQLRAEREVTDRQFLETIPTLPVVGELAYTNSQGTPTIAPWNIVLGHVFNHQTHHRGQVHGMLSQAGLNPPPLDVLYFPRDSFKV